VDDTKVDKDREKPGKSELIRPIPEAIPPPRPPRRRLRLIIAFLAAGLLIGATVWYYMVYVAPYESTDDAFVDGYSTFVSPRVAGPVIKLLVDDNQRVKEGDPILEIDDSDYQTQLAKARADLATAKTRVAQAKTLITVDQAKAEQQEAAVTAAEAIAERADADRHRYESVQSNAVSRTQFDLAVTQATSTSANVKVAQDQAKAATAQVDSDRAELDTTVAQVGQAEATLRQAELNVSYTKVAAPRSGRITHRTVQKGAYVQIGQALLAIVPDYVWVVANFKETQVEHMRPGQPVTIRVDAYPKHEFKGKVDSLQAGSGASFSLLPPENAVGNYVKVVQRVPVKIVFDEPINQTNEDIAPGMSVEPKVRIK
jgi:membrane fusion protein (multidrug efflux system)